MDSCVFGRGNCIATRRGSAAIASRLRVRARDAAGLEQDSNFWPYEDYWSMNFCDQPLPLHLEYAVYRDPQFCRYLPIHHFKRYDLRQ